jgi:hypothetical protein
MPPSSGSKSISKRKPAKSRWRAEDSSILFMREHKIQHAATAIHLQIYIMLTPPDSVIRPQTSQTS